MTATITATSYPYLIIGSGRVARHLSHYFQQLSIPFQSWDRSQDPHALSRKVLSSKKILLAISDSALEGFYRQHLAGHDIIVIHFAGAQHFEGMVAAHPLMTFGDQLYDLESYKRIHFTLTGASSLKEIFPELENPFSLLPAEQKGLYHAYCVLGGNFVSLLMIEMRRGLQGLQLPDEASRVYLEQVFKNTLASSEQSLTGPLIRKDLNTVEKNLVALRSTSLEPLYRAFVKTYWPDYPGK